MTEPERLPAEIAAKRLTVRLWRTADVEPLSRAVEESLDHLRPFMDWVAMEPMEPHDRALLIEGWHAEWKRGGDAVYGVFLDEAPIGGTGLHRRVGPGALEIGYWIHVDHTRKGYATEVARALTETAFDQPGIERVEIHHDEANTASAGVPEKLGFTLVRKVPREPTAPADSGIEWQWAMDRSDWI